MPVEVQIHCPQEVKTQHPQLPSTSFQGLPRRRNSILAQLTMSIMVEAKTLLADTTHENACTSSQVRGMDPHVHAGVGCSTTKPVGASKNTCKRQSATPAT